MEGGVQHIWEVLPQRDGIHTRVHDWIGPLRLARGPLYLQSPPQIAIDQSTSWFFFAFTLVMFNYSDIRYYCVCKFTFGNPYGCYGQNDLLIGLGYVITLANLSRGSPGWLSWRIFDPSLQRSNRSLGEELGKNMRFHSEKINRRKANATLSFVRAVQLLWTVDWKSCTVTVCRNVDGLSLDGPRYTRPSPF